jgi:hypothetical protein
MSDRFARSRKTRSTASLLAAIVLACLPAGDASAQLVPAGMTIRYAAGRVVFCVAKDAILVSTVAAGAPGARMPPIVPLGGGRVAVILGAADWTKGGAEKATQLDSELPGLVRQNLRAASTAEQLDQANDIETLGLSLLEFVRPLIGEIHHKLDLAPNEPLVEVLLAGYTEGYGPEIWSLRYRVQQRNLGNDYWDTRAMRPAYYQLFPPEKGQPQTFVEAKFPSGAAPLALVRAIQSDAATGRIRGSSEQMNEAVTHVLNGESKKAAAAPVAEFLRAVIPAIAGNQANLAIASVDERYRFQWVVAPEEPLPQPQESDPNAPAEPERPSLRRAAPSPR